MVYRVEDCIAFMTEIAPPDLAESWDSVGLQVGDPGQPVRHMGVALDATFEVVSEAVQKGVGFLVVHHPLFFRPLKQLCLDTPMGQIIAMAIQGNLSIYAAHTNLDSVAGGLNDQLCAKLGLEEIQILGNVKTCPEKLLHVEIPVAMRNRVSDLFSSLSCEVSWWHGIDGPEGRVIGRCRLAAYRLSELKGKLRALCSEAVLDAIPAGEGSLGAGLGRTGILSSSLSMVDFSRKVKQDLGLSQVRMVGDPMRPVRRVAVCSGSGAGFISAARVWGADVLVTGDIKYHEATAALEEGIGLVDAGHFGTEYGVVDLLMNRLSRILRERKISGLSLVPLSSCKDPFFMV